MAFNQNGEVVGMTSADIAVPAAGPYFVKGKVQLPRVAAGGSQSAVIVTITNRTGPTTLYTGLAGADGFRVDAVCAAGDVLRVALTSANASDAVVNAVRCTYGVGDGQ